MTGVSLALTIQFATVGLINFGFGDAIPTLYAQLVCVSPEFPVIVLVSLQMFPGVWCGESQARGNMATGVWAWPIRLSCTC